MTDRSKPPPLPPKRSSATDDTWPGGLRVESVEELPEEGRDISPTPVRRSRRAVAARVVGYPALLLLALRLVAPWVAEQWPEAAPVIEHVLRVGDGLVGL